MRTIYFLILLFSPLVAQAQWGDRPDQIQVSASAEVKVRPDLVMVRVGVEKSGSAVTELQRGNSETVERVVASLVAAGVRAEDISTDFLSIDNGFRSSSSEPFFVRRSISFTLRAVDRFESVLREVLEAGVNRVLAVQFRTSKLREHRDEARRLAAIAAQEKADAMASAFGVRRGRLINVSNHEYGGWWSPSWYWNSSFGAGSQNSVQAGGDQPGADAQGSTAEGQISVSATVQASFAIESTTVENEPEP